MINFFYRQFSAIFLINIVSPQNSHTSLMIEKGMHTTILVKFNLATISSIMLYFTDIKNLDREIYHCPYCNLCRVGKGLGIDYFHCMEYNFCISRSLFERVRREKCPENNCPICHEYMFTLNSQVRELPCGHFMHSSCFQVFVSLHFILSTSSELKTYST